MHWRAVSLASNIQATKHRAHVKGQLTHCLGNILCALAFDQTDCESSHSCHIFWAKSFWDSAAVFVIVPVNDIVAAFNDPMKTIILEYLCGRGKVRSFACNPVHYLFCFFTGFFVAADAFNFKCLADPRKVQIIVKFCRYQNASGFNTAMLAIITIPNSLC